MTPPFCPSALPRAVYDLELYADHFETLERNTAEYLEEMAELSTLDGWDERGDWHDLEDWERSREWAEFEREAEPYFDISPVPPQQPQAVAA